MTVTQIVGALAMMISGTALGTCCAMGFLRRYGLAHCPWWRGVLMVAPAAMLFTRGLTAVRGIQLLTPWGETLALVMSLWWVVDLMSDIVGGWRREGRANDRRGCAQLAFALLPAKRPAPTVAKKESRPGYHPERPGRAVTLRGELERSAVSGPTSSGRLSPRRARV